jgi:hypothetical protein
MATKTTKKSTKKSTKKTTAPSVPSASHAGTSNAAADLLAMVGGKKKKTAAKKKTDRPELALDEDQQELMAAWAKAKVLADHFGENLKTAVAELDDEIVPLFYDLMWSQKQQPKNPSLKTRNEAGQVDIEGMLVIMERFMVSMPEIDEEDDVDDVKQKFVSMLINTASLNAAKAEELVENELVIREEKIIPLTELLEGRKVGKEWVNPSSAEQSAATKLIRCIAVGEAPNFTAEELEALVVSTDYKVTVKGGFLQRACTYCDSAEQLKSMLQLIFKPVISHRGAKVGVNDSLADKHKRLIEEAAEVLGTLE